MKNPGIQTPTGQKHYTEELTGRKFRIASPSFFQVNTQQAERLAVLVREMLDLSGGEFVVDAYAGVGTFAVLLADSARKVAAIEESSAAVRDASTNAAGAHNVKFLEGRTEDVLASLDERPDAVIMDPPRAGCHPDALAALTRLAPDRTVYVSCDPKALARDLGVLTRGGLQVQSVQPIDMFPQTHHVETAALLRPIE